MLRTWLCIAQGKRFVSILPGANVDLISDALVFGRLWYGGPNALANEIGYATFSAAHMIP
jgi:hypothetical protein